MYLRRPGTPQPLRRLGNLPLLRLDLCVCLSLSRIPFYASHVLERGGCRDRSACSGSRAVAGFTFVRAIYVHCSSITGAGAFVASTHASDPAIVVPAIQSRGPTAW